MVPRGAFSLILSFRYMIFVYLFIFYFYFWKSSLGNREVEVQYIEWEQASAEVLAVYIISYTVHLKRL